MTDTLTAPPVLDLNALLTAAIQGGASDVHLVAGHKPMVRRHTELLAVDGYEVLTNEDMDQIARMMLGERRYPQLGEKRDLDFAWSVGGLGRFRVNAHYQKEALGIAFRSITADVPELGRLNLPKAIGNMVDLPRGLVLVTGPTGSGKSTTLASLINEMNQRHLHHVITLEDPIEYELLSQKCLIEQREVGSDVTTFASGLKHALRQDPDVILVGEMRDLETTSAAITAAETGHLVLSTMHTQSAAQTISRIIDIYPGEQQNQVRSMLSNTLQAVITQTLFKRTDGQGMIPCCEVMLCTPAVRNCIRDNRLHEIPNIIETSRGQGMILLDEAIKGLVLNGFITREEGLARANNPASLSKALGL